MARRAPFMDYMSAAFLWHWNLLALGAGTVFAFLSGQPDIVLPLLLAGELTYLGMLTAHPRFRKSVDVRKTAAVIGIDHDALLKQIRGVLKPDAWQRFEDLRDRCLRLNDISRQLRGLQAAATPEKVADLQKNSLERLLWVYLKLLYSQDALQSFLRQTDRKDLVQQIDQTKKQVEAAQEKKRDDKFIHSLDDKLATLRQRLDNYDRAFENREFLSVELDRIEQKVNAISELAINARDASAISAQVDGIADGVAATEEAMRSLDVAPVFEHETVPQLLTEQN